MALVELRPNPSVTLPAKRKAATDKKSLPKLPRLQATLDDEQPAKIAVVEKGRIRPSNAGS